MAQTINNGVWSGTEVSLFPSQFFSGQMHFCANSAFYDDQTAPFYV